MLSLNIPPWKLFGWLKGQSYGQLLIGIFITTMHLLVHHVSCRVFWWNRKSPRWLSPDLAPCDFWAVPKPKISFEREEISDCRWDSGKHDGAADGHWENCVGSQGAYFKRDWGIIVLCTVFLVSCIFFNKCLFFWILSGQTSCVSVLIPETVTVALFGIKGLCRCN